MNLDNTSNNAGAPAPTSKPVTTLAQTIAALQTRLKETFEPAYNRNHDQYDNTLIHPLSLSKVEATNENPFTLPLEIISYSLQYFENGVLNAGLEGNSTSNMVSNEKLRLLALYKESSALELQNLSTSDGMTLARQVRKRRKDYKVQYPVDGQRKVQEIIESLAKECGWEVFPGGDGMGDEGGLLDDFTSLGDAGDMQIDPTDGSKKKTVTLTIAGKGIVLDIDIETSAMSGTQPASSSQTSPADQVAAVRFSYGLEGTTDPGIDKMLLRQAKEKEWDNLRSSLVQLAILDELIENPSESQSESVVQKTIDPFGSLKNLALKIEEVFKAELDVIASPSQLLIGAHGLALTYHNNPYFSLIIHLSASSLFTEEWRDTISSGYQNEQLDRLFGLPGTRFLEFGVHKVDASSRLPTSALAAPQRPKFSQLPVSPIDLDSPPSEGLIYTATFNEPIYITQSTGRKIAEVVFGPNSPASMNFFAGQTGYTMPAMRFENYLLSQTPIFFGLMQEKDIPGVPRFRLMHNTPLPPATSTAIQLESLQFSIPAQLLALTEILRVQCLYTELLVNTFQSATLLSSESIKDDSEVKLLDLFSDAPNTYSSLTLDSDVSVFPPSLSGTLVLPHLPGWLLVSMQFKIVPSLEHSTGYLLEYTIDAPPEYPEVQQRVQELLSAESGQSKLNEVLGISRDLCQVVRWISKRLERSAGSNWQDVLQKPSWVID